MRGGLQEKKPTEDSFKNIILAGSQVGKKAIRFWKHFKAVNKHLNMFEIVEKNTKNI